jgi:5,10-methylenetetrahydromethanopterin reductase
MRIGIGIGELSGVPVDMAGLVAQAKQAEADGFASGWLAQIFGVDAIMAAAILGLETARIEIGTAVVPTYPRHPVALAQQALTAQAAAGGRFTLGIGLSHAIVIESMLGMSFAKPFTHMREYLAVLAPLIREGQASFEGSEYRVNASVSVPGARPCQILLAALAPKMLGLAGSVADGTVTWMTGPRTLREHTVPRISEAAAGASRPAPRIVVALPVAVTTEVEAARRTASKRFEIYGQLPSYRAMLDREGDKEPADLCIVGDEDHVGEQISRLAEIGVTDYVAVPFPAVAGDSSIGRTRQCLAELARRHAS